jgi:hypothetical protein
MVEANKEAFDSFSKLHFEYSTDPEAYQERFNREGEKILTIIRQWEGKLCRAQEKTYSQYAGGLADKFWGEVRAHFPKIDSVGIIVVKAKETSSFNLKRISF